MIIQSYKLLTTEQIVLIVLDGHFLYTAWPYLHNRHLQPII